MSTVHGPTAPVTTPLPALEPGLRLDDVVGHPDVSSRHDRRVDAPPGQVWDALLTASVDSHPAVRLLMGARALPRRIGRRPPAPPQRRRTLLQMAPYPLVSVTSGRAVIMAGVGQPWRLTNAGPPPRFDLDEIVAFDAPGWVKIAMDIRVDATADGSTVTSETRVKATDEAARRAFRAYWTLIRSCSMPSPPPPPPARPALT